MALNQVIHGSNRVVENPNRYKLNPVAGQANTYDFEKQPGVITDNGTPYNKRILDQIDNVLSYLTPSVEKVISQEKIVYTNTIINEDKNLLTKISDLEYDGDINVYDIIGTCKITSCEAYSSSKQVNNIIVDDGTGFQSERYQTNKFVKLEFSIPIIATKFKVNASNGGVHYYIDGSNDNSNWTRLYDDYIPTYTLTEIEITKPNKYKYYRLSSSNTGTSTSYYLYVQYFVVSEYLNVLNTTYQNQFTLDNNTSFTNNQRVLIETDKNVEEITGTVTNLMPLSISRNWSDGDEFDDFSETLTTFQGITPSVYYKGNAKLKATSSDVSNKISLWAVVDNYTKFTNVEYLQNSSNTESSSAYSYNRFKFGNGTSEFSIVYDFKINVKATFKYKMALDNGTLTTKNIQVSDDNINWTTLDTINVNNESATLVSNDYYRYYRFIFESSNNARVGTYYMYVSSLDYIIRQEMPYQNVESNTLNGIDIPTLLQPSTKYELIYDETNNKFNLGGNLTLFDITLTEAVNQVDLIGIGDKLKIGKVYALYIYGGTSTTNSVNVLMGTSPVTDAESYYVRTPFIFSLIFKDNANVLIGGCSNSTSSTSNYASSNLLNNEYIKVAGNQTFNAGTRIIIKEVA